MVPFIKIVCFFPTEILKFSLYCGISPFFPSVFHSNYLPFNFKLYPTRDAGPQVGVRDPHFFNSPSAG